MYKDGEIAKKVAAIDLIIHQMITVQSAAETSVDTPRSVTKILEQTLLLIKFERSVLVVNAQLEN